MRKHVPSAIPHQSTSSASPSHQRLPLGLRVWRALTRLFGWYLPILIWRRQRRGLEDKQRKQERFGRTTLARPEGQLIWIQAVSVGETMSVLSLAQQLADATQNRYVLFTTNTRTSANILAQLDNQAILHQFNPLDHPAIVERFLAYWRPDIAIFVESEIWPNLLHAVMQKGIVQILLNARLSARSYRRWRWARGLFAYLLSGFQAIVPQDEITENRLHKLLGDATRMQKLGNLKLDAPPLPADEDMLAQLKANIKSRPVWVAASTHDGEEEPIAAAHFFIRNHHPDLLTIIVPRHPIKGNALRDSLKEIGLSVAQRSQNDTIMPDTQIYLADTIGELGLFYRLCDVVFMGGSLVPGVGGQNPMEPARLGCAILHGGRVENFSRIYSELAKCNATSQVDDANELGGAVSYLLAGSGEGRRIREARAKAAKKFAARQTNITTAHKEFVLRQMAS